MVPKKTEKKKKKKGTKVKKTLLAKGKRKSSIARATIQEGSGRLRINGISIKAYTNGYVKSIITEPLNYIGAESNSINIDVNVRGGGFMGQAQAARTAIGNALASYFGEKVREELMNADRSMLVSDSRRVESKKYKGPKSRARYQKSYR